MKLSSMHKTGLILWILEGYMYKHLQLDTLLDK